MDNMSNHISQNSPEKEFLGKRKKMLAAVTEEIVSSDDDDYVDDGMDVCKIMENKQIQVANSSALHALGETIRNTLLEINVIREQNRERRHRELMQVLAKMVQQESIKSRETCSNDVRPVAHAIQDSTENGCTAKTNCDNNNQNHTDSANATKDISSKYIKMHDDHVNNQLQVCKIKNGTAAKKDDKELQQMRTQMLEIQRKKMEDRERKKREFTRVLNV